MKTEAILGKQAWMLLLSAAGVWLSACSGAPKNGEQVPGAGLYSEGYRMGQLTKYSIRGFPWSKAGEGTMLLGYQSGLVKIPISTDERGKTTYRTLNPWDFSTTVEQKGNFESKVGEMVWLRYNQAQFKNPFQYGTSYLAAELRSVTQTPPAICSSATIQGNYSTGSRMGRIVKASLKGIFDGIKTYEIILQEGGAGSKFVEMSITDAALYDCAVQWLKSGLSARIDYKQVSFNFSWNNTSYRIWRIQPLSQLP
jgi:hypothetical protein